MSNGHLPSSGRLPTEEITLTSVGIDIGSATTQVLFSEIELQRMGWNLSSQFVVVARRVIGHSGIRLTPYLDDTTIDAEAVTEFVKLAYRDLGLHRDDVDTGAVILTGEATRRENSRAIADSLASSVGEFVCATAGHHMEATLAAHGSGAVALSKERGRVLNIDIGGGTTKLSDIEAGHVRSTAAIHVGGRLASFSNGRIAHLDPGGLRISELVGVPWHLDGPVSWDQIEQVADWMAEAVVTAILHGDQADSSVKELFLTEPLDASADTPFDAVVCSGGVSEYIYGRHSEDHGDLGLVLGERLAAKIDTMLPWPLHDSSEGVQATVIGASQYSVQISGNTIYVSESATLPVANLRVARPKITLDRDIEPHLVSQQIREHLQNLELKEGEDHVALALTWEGTPSYGRVSAFAQAIEEAMPNTLSTGKPLCLVFDGDVGGAVGALIGDERQPSSAVISIDGISLTDFEFIDIGKISAKTGSVPVSIKSLIFNL